MLVNINLSLTERHKYVIKNQLTHNTTEFVIKDNIDFELDIKMEKKTHKIDNNTNIKQSKFEFKTKAEGTIKVHF